VAEERWQAAVESSAAQAAAQERCPVAFAEVIRRCWAVYPSIRPTAAELVKSFGVMAEAERAARCPSVARDIWQPVLV
jgi:hypothetical protein